MPLINQALPNLIGGVSQQPDVTRFEGQCEAQENALSSIVDGLSKRPQTKHVAELVSSAISNNSFTHFINRTADEKYVVIHDGSSLKVFNLDGTNATIDSAASKTCGEGEYLYTTNPKQDLKALTIGDKTFILNKNTNVLPDYTSSSALLSKEAGLFIKQGDYGKNYGVSFSGNFNTSNTSAGIARCNIVFERKYRSRTSPYGHAAFQRFCIGVKSINFNTSGTTGHGSATGGFDYLANEPITINLPDTVLSQIINANGTNIQYGGLLFGTDLDPSSSVSSSNANLDTYSLGSFSISSVSSTGAIQGITVNNGGKYGLMNHDYDHESWASGDFVVKNVAISAPTGAAHYGTATVLEAEIQSALSGVNNVDTEVIINTLITDSSATTTSLSDVGNGKVFQSVDRTNNDNFVAPADHTTANPRTEFEYKKSNNLLIFSRASNLGDFDISANDGIGGLGIGAFYKQTSAITNLPLYNKNGFRIKIVGDADSTADEYYVKFETKNNAPYGEGSYVEDIGYNVLQTIDSNTLPFALTLNAENEFTSGALAMASRKVGDDTSNPMPSFVNRAINDIFIYKDRLGFLTEDHIVMSEAGLGVVENGELKFNFFKTTVTTLLDSAAIDVTVSSNRVTNLKAAIGFQENLILFSDNMQFGLKSGELLTPNSVSVNPITNFEFDQTVEPLGLGSYLYFPFQRGSFSGIREFTVNSTTDNYDAEEITEHIPTYIPSDLETMVGSTSEDIIIGFAPSTPKTLYIYKYFWGGQKKLLSAWSKFLLPFEVRGFDVFEGTMYVVGTKESKTHLLSMPLQSGLKDTGMNYNTYLDMRKEQTLSNATAVPLGFTASAGDRVQVWDDEGQSLHDQTLTSTATSVTLGTAHTGKVFSGLAYTMKYVFSEQVFKQQAGNSKAPSGFTRAQIRNGALFFNDTRGFKVKVKPDNRDETTHTFTPTLIGTSSAGNIELNSGNFRFPVFTDAQGTTITVENDSALPANFSSAEFETFVHERSKRFG
tara:strand:- start:1724 stop:4726 length:3003 start_codon:yes stop_codon:yes gene_type:complete